MVQIQTSEQKYFLKMQVYDAINQGDINKPLRTKSKQHCLVWQVEVLREILYFSCKEDKLCCDIRFTLSLVTSWASHLL